MKLAIITSAHTEVPKELKNKALELARQLSNINNIEILTGGCLGVLEIITKHLRKKGKKVCAYSPDQSKEEHNQRRDNLHTKHFDSILHHQGFTERSIKMITDADCILALNGRMGTLSEFTIALEEGKKIAVLTGTGGISDHLKEIMKLTNKKFDNQIVFSSNIEKILKFIRTKD